MDNVELEITDEAPTPCSQASIERKTGAHGLRA